MPTFRTACPYDCPDGCSLLVTLENGRVVKVAGDPANPLTAGLVCPKLAHLADSIHSPKRLLTPLRRTGPKGTGQFAPISEIATRWKAMPPTAILPYSFAGTLGAVQRNCGEAFFHALGARKLARTICSSAKRAGWSAVMGPSADLSPLDLDKSDFFLLWSCNVPATRLHLMPILRRAKEAGKRLVLIDVYESPTAPLASQCVLVKPGSDGALALSMLQVIAEEGLTDEGYLAAHTTGWPELKASLPQWTPEATQAVTGVAPEVVRALAREYAAAQAPAILLGTGYSRSGNGGETTRAILALPAAVGAWAKPGGGTCGIAAAPNLIDRTLVSRPDFALPGVPTVNMNQLGQALEGTEIQSLYVYHGNPAAVAPDQNAIFRGLLREDLFTVVHERFMTDTARYADILLPAPFMAETEDLYAPYGYRGLQWVKPILPLPGECKSNWEVFQLLAQAMDLPQAHFKWSVEDLCLAMIDRCTALSPEMRARLLAGEPVVLPAPFPLPAGKIQLSQPAPPAWTPPYGGPEPFRLVTAPAIHTLNSTCTESEPLLALRGERSLLMCPADAARLGLTHGDQVLCRNELGQADFRLRTDRAVSPGTVVAEGVYSGPDSVNSLLHQRLTDLGAASTLNDNTVEILPL